MSARALGHGGFVWISGAFVATADFVGRLRQVGVSGFETCPVEVVRVATKGRRAQPPTTGEPEDQILKRGNVLSGVPQQLPTLFGIRVTGSCEVQPSQEGLKEEKSTRVGH